MNRNNKILVGVLAFIVAMTIGYALFSDNITITGTAKAKGDFGVTATCEFVTENTDEGLEASTGTGSCSVNGKTVTTTGNYSKPTDNNTYKVTLKNTGSIPAVLKTVDSSNNYDVNMTGSGDVFYIDKVNALMSYYALYKDGTQIESIGDSSIEQAKITLQPNEELTLIIFGGWMNSEDLHLDSQPKLPEEGVQMNYNITLGFEQVTNN